MMVLISLLTTGYLVTITTSFVTEIRHSCVTRQVKAKLDSNACGIIGICSTMFLQDDKLAISEYK